MKIIKIDTEYIKLDQFLKFTGVAGNGGEAKMLILAGKAAVNGATETRRGRKLRPGDSVEINSSKFTVE
ncbi:MAG: RNA-binding S4 domain-containing protein [Clostridia bacterium]